MTRTQLQRKHALKRAEERYGLKLTNDDIIHIISMIKHQKSISSKKLTNTRSLHIVNYADCELKTIYDNKRHNICTFLPV